MEKPHNGDLFFWRRTPFNKDVYSLPENLGYVITGSKSRERLSLGTYWQTSAVVKHNEETGEIETLNSRYQLIGEEYVPKQRVP